MVHAPPELLTMRRPVFAVLLACAAVTALGLSVSAAGPGGWDHLGNGGSATLPALNGAVYALNTDDPGVLFVGGAFTDAGGHPAADHIASWNGSAWHALGPANSLNGAVEAIAYHAGRVFAGGQFTNAGGNANADFLAVWNGVSWAPFCNAASGPAFGGSVDALQIIGNTLFVGGAFQNGGDIDAADYLLACNLTTGASSSTVPNDGDMNGGVYALTADSNGVLYAGGQFINVEGIAAADHVAAYDGTWHAMGSGPGPGTGAVDDYVRSLAASGTNVYVGTDSVNVAGITNADHVVRWNGSSWSAVGANTAGTNGWFPSTSFIYALAASGARVYASGSFQNANGVATADEIGYFDGTSWHPIGSDGAGNGPLTAQGSALAIYSGSLVVGGPFINAGGDLLADALGSYALKRPDARIANAAAGPFHGNNIYSSTGAGESLSMSVARGQGHGDLFIDVQNDGLVPATFTVHGTGAATGYKVDYYSGATKVTSQVKAGTFSTGSLAPGAHVTLKLTVKLSAGAAPKGTFLVVAASAGASPDAVKAIVNAK
jgi:hypothetical protein